MKVRVSLKDPDGFYDSIGDAVKADVAAIPGLDDDEREALEETRRETVGKVLGKWVEYGEYVELEFDTDAGTAVVVERRK